MKTSSRITNKQMQELADRNDANCPIDNNGDLQSAVDDNTAYIVDSNAKMKGDKMKVILDREGNYFHFVEVKKWW
jgi:hypothetical protein